MSHSSIRNVRLHVEQLEEREVPSAVFGTESFDQVTKPALPPGWEQWASDGNNAYTTSSVRSVSGTQSLSSTAISSTSSRFWNTSVASADTGVQASIYIDSLVPTQLIIRGSDLDSATPTFYALTVTRGVTIELSRVVDGVSTTLANLKSTSYVSGRWLCVSLVPDGDELSAVVQRHDNGQYLDSTGKWVATQATAMSVTDSTIHQSGHLGVGRAARYAGAVAIDDIASLPASNDTTVTESFDTTAAGRAPAGWSSYSNDKSAFVAAGGGRSGNGISSNGLSTSSSRLWASEALPANVEASVDLFVDSLVPGQLIVRGNQLDSTSADYYALSITRGTTVSLVRVNDGVSTSIVSLRSTAYTSSLWVRATLTAEGDHLQARIQRLDTGAWLNQWGDWQDEPAAALDARDTTIRTGGNVGVARPRLYAGKVTFDNFAAMPNFSDITGPTLTVTPPIVAGPLSGEVGFRIIARDAGGINRVEYIVDNLLVAIDREAGYDWLLDTRNFENGAHRLTVRAHDEAGNVVEVSGLFTFSNTQAALPTIPRHYSHIRIAALAYSGNPMGAFEKQLLQTSIDLVVPNPRYLGTIQQTSPDTPQLIYSNASNIYLELLTDWLKYADARNVSRELAFYHVAKPTAFSGASSSAVPVTWFWNASVGPNSGTAGHKRLTAETRNSTTGDVLFGSVGTSLYLGYTENFREINVSLSSAKKAGWSGVFEYATATDANGNPTAWKTLSINADTTNGLAQSGQITFDPPRDWVTSTIPGSTALLYYVRVRTLTGTTGTGPIATSILGRDYVNARGGSTGTIPAFDHAADRDGDGYLNNAEYAARRAGNDARFVYESRLFYPFYGQHRYVTDPAQQIVRDWSADYHVRFLNANPLADGLFFDNSSGRNPVYEYDVIEETATYAADYGALLATVERAIAPRWIMANTSNGGVETDYVVEQVPGTMEEFAIRAMSANWSQFNDLAAIVKRRQDATDPSGYMVIDSLSTGGSPTDARTQIATLSYYYMIGDSQSTMLMLWGGEEPNTTWSRHWFNALTYNVGEAKGDYSLFTTGRDPANTALSYNVYQREYDNALVLYKPLSYALGRGIGTTASATATTHQLNGTYRVLAADGTLGAPVTSVTLRNGEGAVLIKS